LTRYNATATFKAINQHAAVPASTVAPQAVASAGELRGIPAIGRGSSSVMPGTQPEAALLAKERHRAG
jgi:hypothetical protein